MRLRNRLKRGSGRLAAHCCCQWCRFLTFITPWLRRLPRFAPRRHLAYLKYVLRHKWYVYLAGRKLGVSLWRLLSHDMSKFRPSEWAPYAHTFYARDGVKRYAPHDDFYAAWLFHQRRNPHHWQAWVLQCDDPSIGTHGNGLLTIPMPHKYAAEMVADWAGAGRAITGTWECKQWYTKNRCNIMLHPSTRTYVEELIDTWQQKQ